MLVIHGVGLSPFLNENELVGMGVPREVIAGAHDERLASLVGFYPSLRVYMPEFADYYSYPLMRMLMAAE